MFSKILLQARNASKALKTLFALFLVQLQEGFGMEKATLTLAVPKRLKKEMTELKGVNWSEETRQFLEERVKRLRALKQLDEATKNSELTEEDAVRLGRVINKRLWEKHYKKLV